MAAATMKSEGVERATAAVVVNGRRWGSGVLVDRRHALTARHVIGSQSPAGTEVELRFPALGASVQAVSIDIGEWATEMDITLLELIGDLTAGLEVPEWLPFVGAADGVRVFGYPLLERDLEGIWVQATPAGLTTSGLLQLDATGATSALSGHSGGPVVDAATGAVVGVLVEGSKELRFDRAVPIELVARHCTGVVGWWLFAGDNAVEHFRRRATGQRSIVRGGDLFQGRHAALRRIGGSAADEMELPLVVTGQPGAGKSTVLARAALAERERVASTGLAFHARGQGIGDLVRAVARVAAAPPSPTWQELVDHLTECVRVHLALFVDALDEMATDRDIADAARFLRELSSLDGLSVTVASRWRAPGGDRRVRDLPSQLGAIAGSKRDTLVDLDSDRYFDADDLLTYTEAVLCQEGALRPGPRDAAWVKYRRDRRPRRRLAEAIVRRAARNYLVAAMAAFPLSESDELVDPRRPGFDERRDLPGTVGEALDKYLDRVSTERRQKILGLLVALAYAEGSGLTDDRWRAFTEALGYARPSLEDLDALRASGAADYLLQTTGGDSGRTTRLFHQALADHLHETRDTRNDQRRLASCLVAELPNGDWSQAAEYLRQHGPAHLAAGGLLDEHLADVRFLLAVHPERLIQVLPLATSTAARQAAHVYELAFHQLTTKPGYERPAYLHLTARCAGCDSLASALMDAVRTSPWGVVWAQWRPSHPHRLLGRHRSTVSSVAVIEFVGEPVVVSGSHDGTVRVWRLDGGSLVGEPWRSSDWVTAVTAGQLEGGPVIVSGGGDGVVCVWWLNGGASVGEPWRGHDGVVTAMAVGELEGRPVVVSSGEDGTVRVWQLAGGAPLGVPAYGHAGRVNAVAVGELNACPVVVSGGADGTVRVWQLAGGAPVGDPWYGHDGRVNAVAVGELEGHPVVVSGGGDGTVRVWRLDSGTPVGEPWRGHDWVDAVAVGELEDHPIVVSGGRDGTVRAWLLDGGAPIGEPWRGHDWVRTVAVGELDGYPAVISGGKDGTVRVWRLDRGTRVGEPWRGHEGWVNAVAVCELDGESVVVSDGEDETVRVWRLDSGAPVGEPWRGHLGGVYALAAGKVEGRPIVVSGGRDGTVRVWRLDSGAPVGRPWRGHDGWVYAVAIGEVEGCPMVVSGGGDGTVRVWQLDSGAPVGRPWHGHDGWVYAVAIGTLADRPVVVSGGQDGTVRAWWCDSGVPICEPWHDDDDWVRAVVVWELEGHAVVVSGGHDGTVRMRRLEGGAPVGRPWRHDGRVSAVTVGELEGHPVVVSGSWNGTVRLWRLGEEAEQQVIDLGSAVRALAFASPCQLVIGTTMGIVVLRLGSAGAGGDGR
jgi:WD40 repeat protein